jgi:hypothetical protein
MRTRRSLAAAVALLAAAGFGAAARAEVAAEVDLAGNYVRTTVLASASAKKPRIWSVQRSSGLARPLNPGGDQSGDLWPAIAENPQDSNHPWVVWSRGTGAGYDLAWSRWLPGGWTDPDWVEEAANASAGDDLDPRLAVNSEGRPYLVWWRDEGGEGRVYLSMFLFSRWMPAYPVSDPEVDSRRPRITLVDDGRIQVDYDTPAGRIIRLLVFSHPLSITDDLDPFARLNSDATPIPPSNASR